MITGLPTTKKFLFTGVDKFNAPEMMLDTSCEDCLDVYSSPLGGLCTRNGFARLHTTSVSSSAVITGGWQLGSADIFMANDQKIYTLSGTAAVELASSTGASDADKHWSCFNGRNDAGALIAIMIHADLGRPWKYTGSGSAATLAGTIITADFGVEWQRYYWLHKPNTCDVYYNTTIDNAESGYSSYLRFDEVDPRDYVNGLAISGDDMVALKRWSCIRTVYRPGSGASKFQKFTIEGGIGTESHWSIKRLPQGQLIWLGPDNNIWMLSGNTIRPVGDLIQPFLRDCNQSRMQYASAGVNRKLGHYWLSVTYGSAQTTHNRVLVMDYLHPYQDKKGQLQYPWWIYSRVCHTLWEAFSAGVPYLYSGDYTGYANKEDSGTADGSSAIPNNGYWLSKAYSEDAPTIDKKYRSLMLSTEYKGSYNMYCEIITDKDQATSQVKEISLARGASILALWDVAKWDVDSWGSDTPTDTSVHIDRIAKVIQYKLYGDSTVSHPWRVYSFSPIIQGLKQTHRVREG